MYSPRRIIISGEWVDASVHNWGKAEWYYDDGIMSVSVGNNMRDLYASVCGGNMIMLIDYVGPTFKGDFTLLLSHARLLQRIKLTWAWAQSEPGKLILLISRVAYALCYGVANKICDFIPSSDEVGQKRRRKMHSKGVLAQGLHKDQENISGTPTDWRTLALVCANYVLIKS